MSALAACPVNEALLVQVQDAAGIGIHSAIFCAIGRAVIFEGRASYILSRRTNVYASDCAAGTSDDSIQNVAQLADMSLVVVRLLMLSKL
jgi:hypothetical protein